MIELDETAQGGLPPTDEETAAQQGGPKPDAGTEPPEPSDEVVEVEGELVEEGPEETPAPAPPEGDTAEAIIERAVLEIEPTALADLATEEQITRAVARIVQRARAIKKFRAAMLAMTNVRDWYVRLARRPAVERGYIVPKKVTDIPMP